MTPVQGIYEIIKKIVLHNEKNADDEFAVLDIIFGASKW